MTASSEQTTQEAGHDGTGEINWALMTDSSKISKIPAGKFPFYIVNILEKFAHKKLLMPNVLFY